MRQKSLFRAALAAALLGGACAASAADAPAAPAPAPKPVRVVATIFPAWDWTREVLGARNDGVELTLLLDDDDDDDHAEHHDDDDDDDHHDDEDGEEELDEHVWLSLRHARTLVGAIADSLAALDPARAEAWRANAAAYGEKLAALDKEYAATVAAAPRKTLVVADRFPLRYLADDYGLAYFAAFSGCSAETEASFKTVIFLAGKADALGAKSLLVLEGAKHRIAETVRAATKAKDQSISVFDSLQSATAAEAAAGTTYLDAMRRNRAALAEALK